MHNAVLRGYMQRREFMTLAGGAAVALPITARAQQIGQRRIGALMLQSENNEQGSSARVSFEQGLAKLGWTVGRNLEIDYRWASMIPKRQGSPLPKYWRSRRTSS
jgi:putative tryptophan/tyrosine transport system substrate-binding protein